MSAARGGWLYGWLLGLVLNGALAWAVLLPARVFAQDPPALIAQQVAPGVYVFVGSPGQASPTNGGRIGNASFIVGPLGVLVIDSGSSYLHGREMLQTIRNITELPIRALLLTQARPEFIFGAKAFQDAGVSVWMHQRAIELMTARCALCLSRLRKGLGEVLMAGTEIVRPDFSLGQGMSIKLIGRPLQILDLGPSSGPGDLAVWDPISATLIAAGLVDHQRIPDLLDAQVDGWLQALEVLAELPIARVIPGHGPPGMGALLAEQKQYLQELRSSVQSALQSGISLGQLAGLMTIGPRASWAKWSNWDGYPQQHIQNLQTLYLRLEQSWLQRP